MARSLKTVVGAIVALGLAAAIFVTSRQLAPAAVDVEKISAHPENYLLRYEEMPENTDYYAPGSYDNSARPYPIRIHNTFLIDYFGREKAGTYVAAYERVDGWYIAYQRRNDNDPGFEAIDNWLTIHQTPQGAQKVVKENPISVGGGVWYSYPRDSLGALSNLGDAAQASKKVMAISPGFERTTYQVDFAYQTISVRVEVTDYSSRVSLDDATLMPGWC